MNYRRAIGRLSVNYLIAIFDRYKLVALNDSKFLFSPLSPLTYLTLFKVYDRIFLPYRIYLWWLFKRKKKQIQIPSFSRCFCRPTTRIFTSSLKLLTPGTKGWSSSKIKSRKCKKNSPNKPMEQGIYWPNLRLGCMETRKKLKRLQRCNLNCFIQRFDISSSSKIKWPLGRFCVAFSRLF